MRTRVLNTVNWKKYLIPNDSKRVQTFLEHNGDAVFRQITDRVCRAIRLKTPQLVLVVHRNANNAIVIKQKEYLEFLEIANDWFLKKEFYEMCDKIKNYKKIHSTNITKEKKIKSNV